MKSNSGDRKIRIGVAGLGGIAKRTHLPILNMLPGFEVVCGAERDVKQQRRVCRLFNIGEVFEDYLEMIQQASLDAVFICLPANLHMRAVSAALEKGLHVFCEKPMGLNSSETEEMINLADKMGLILMPGFNLRWVYNFRRAKELIGTGKLGKIIQINALFMNPGPYISWDPKSDWYLEGESHGALYDIGSHIIDLLFYLYPHKVKTLSASASKGYLPYEVITNVICSYEGEDGLLGAINIGWRTASEVCSLEFHGTAGTLLVSRRNFNYIHGATDPADRVFNSLGNAVQELWTVARKLNLMRKGADVLEEFRLQALEFRKLILRGWNPDGSLLQIAYVHKALEALLTSVNDHKYVAIVP